VPLSFGAPGFAIHSLPFEPTDLDIDLSGCRIVITGATSGLSFAATRVGGGFFFDRRARLTQ
jgi:hypothetical protein